MTKCNNRLKPMIRNCRAPVRHTGCVFTASKLLWFVLSSMHHPVPNKPHQHNT